MFSDILHLPLSPLHDWVVLRWLYRTKLTLEQEAKAIWFYHSGESSVDEVGRVERMQNAY